MKNAVDEAVGSQIRGRRLAMDLSIEMLANKLEISEDTLRSFEDGTRHVDAATLKTVAEILRVSLSYFFQNIR